MDTGRNFGGGVGGRANSDRAGRADHCLDSGAPYVYFGWRPEIAAPHIVRRYLECKLRRDSQSFEHMDKGKAHIIAGEHDWSYTEEGGDPKDTMPLGRTSGTGCLRSIRILVNYRDDT